MSGLGLRDDAKTADALRSAVEFACAAAAGHGVDIVLEPLNGRDMPGYFLNDFNYAVDLITKIGAPNLKLQYDIYHRQIMHGDVLKSLEAMLPVIGHVQIASVPGRHEPGTGELDDVRILRHLDDIGYDGFVGCEYRPANGTLAGLVWRDMF
jgi:2-dehydrotetronate isomerase